MIADYICQEAQHHSQRRQSRSSDIYVSSRTPKAVDHPFPAAPIVVDEGVAYKKEKRATNKDTRTQLAELYALIWSIGQYRSTDRAVCFILPNRTPSEELWSTEYSYIDCMTGIGLVLVRLGLSQYTTRFIDEGFETWETVLDIIESDL